MIERGKTVEFSDMSGLKKKEQKMKTLGNKNKHAEFKETQILNMN